MASVERSGHDCPECRRWHDDPGPTRRFHNYIEKYAAKASKLEREAMYELRSSLVHGRKLHELDVPRARGALVPSAQEDFDVHRTALGVAGVAIRTWFMEQTHTA